MAPSLNRSQKDGQCPKTRQSQPSDLHHRPCQQDDWVKAPNENMRTEALKMGNNFLTTLPPAFNIIIRSES
jgi:hypothetical protein